MSVEIVASTRKKSKEKTRAEYLIPDEIKNDAPNIITFLRDYAEFMNAKLDGEMYDNPSAVIAKIEDQRNLDKADEQFLDKLKNEIAVSIPKNLTTDKVNLYKNLIKYYSIRGASGSIDTFFKILYDDTAEIYYPKSDLFIPSSGRWDSSIVDPDTGNIEGDYIDRGGFLSDVKKLQDSYYWQNYSYVIKTGRSIDDWKDTFNRLVHPAGFIFFGEILIIIVIQNKMPQAQPGFIGPEDFTLLVIAIAGQESPTLPNNSPFLFLFLENLTPDMGLTERYNLNKNLFNDPSPMKDYEDLTMEEFEAKQTNWNKIPSTIFIL